MVYRISIAASILLGVLMIIALACQSSGANPGDATPLAGTVGSDDTTPPAPTVEPADPTLVEVLAPIQSVNVRIAESFPPQYFLEVTSGLPNGCVKFGSYEVARDGDTIKVTVTNVQPEANSLTACTMQYGTVDTNIALGIDFEPSTTYTVVVNDASTSFTAQGQQQALEIEEPAPIESVTIEKVAAKPPNSTLVIVSGLPNGCTELAGHGLRRDGDTITVEITNLLQLGVPCTEEYRTVETRMPIDGGVEACKVYEVIVNNEPHRVQAVDPSISCDTPEPVETPVAGTGAGETEVAPAIVENVRIEFERGPIGQSELVVVTGLPNACYELDDYGMVLDGDTIRVKITNLRHIRDACAEIYQLVENRFSLGTDIEGCKVYTVNVNGEVYTVQAIGPTIRCAAPEPVGTPTSGDSIIPVEVPAPIEGVQVVSTRSIPPDYFLSISSALPNGCVKFGGYEVEVKGHTINVTVTNIQPGDSDVICTMQYGTVETRIELGRDFDAATDYTVVVNGATAATFHTPGSPAGQTGQDAAQDIGRPFEVKLHETATVESQDLSIEFIEILEDSRCAANVTCIWAGRARVLIGISLRGEEARTWGSTNWPSKADRVTWRWYVPAGT